MTTKTLFPWTTAQEIKFMRTLGRHHEGGPPLTRMEALRNYRVGLLKRARWDEIDRTRVMAALDLEILKEA